MTKVCYMGSAKRVDVAGLEPNQLYHFRLRYVGSRTHSQLSPPLKIMTVPLPPSPPVVCRLTASGARIKWYPSPYGAFKFLVQLLPAGVGTDWQDVYNGPENTWTGVALTPDLKYR